MISNVPVRRSVASCLLLFALTACGPAVSASKASGVQPALPAQNVLVGIFPLSVVPTQVDASVVRLNLIASSSTSQFEMELCTRSEILVSSVTSAAQTCLWTTDAAADRVAYIAFGVVQTAVAPFTLKLYGAGGGATMTWTPQTFFSSGSKG